MREQLIEPLWVIAVCERVAETARGVKPIACLSFGNVSLEFFGLEESFLTWSVERCPSEELSEVRMALAAWRDIFGSYAERFPPSEEICRNYVSLRHFAREARAAGTKILAVYHKLDHYLGVREGAGEQAA